MTPLLWLGSTTGWLDFEPPGPASCTGTRCSWPFLRPDPSAEAFADALREGEDVT
jgi:hypothetical protein